VGKGEKMVGWNPFGEGLRRKMVVLNYTHLYAFIAFYHLFPEAISQIPAATCEKRKTRQNKGSIRRKADRSGRSLCLLLCCSSVKAPLRGFSLLAPRSRPKSLAAPSAAIYEMASSVNVTEHLGAAVRRFGCGKRWAAGGLLNHLFRAFPALARINQRKWLISRV